MLGAVPLLDVGLHRPIKRRVVPGQVLKPISGVVFSRVIIAATVKDVLLERHLGALG